MGAEGRAVYSTASGRGRRERSFGHLKQRAGCQGGCNEIVLYNLSATLLSSTSAFSA